MHFSQYPHLDMDDVMGGVRLFFNREGTGLVEPVNISKLAREIHQDAAMRVPTGRELPRAEHDGSYYGRGDGELGVTIEDRKIGKDENERLEYRFVWDGPVVQPYVGSWQLTRDAAFAEARQWARQNFQIITVNDMDVTEKPAANEHLPGAPCVVPECPKPSTFDEYCARHYCLAQGHKLGLSL